MLMVGRTIAAGESSVPIVPTREAVVTWNARVSAGSIELRLGARDGRVTDWLPYVRFDPAGRRSFPSRDSFARIDTDVVRSSADLVMVGVRTTRPMDAIFVSTPSYGASSSSAELPAVELEVPSYAQYVPGYEEERGWCAPATLAMLLAFHGHPIRVDAIAREVFDSGYGGTGNWAFNMAFAATLGLRAAVVHLRDLSHAHAFLCCGMPLGLSIAWARNKLPGAPLSASSGHLVVLRGIGADGTVIANDPAQPAISVTYPREEFERAWISHGGIAFAVAPASHERTLLQLANR
jgi:hypothetical protein